MDSRIADSRERLRRIREQDRIREQAQLSRHRSNSLASSTGSNHGTVSTDSSLSFNTDEVFMSTPDFKQSNLAKLQGQQYDPTKTRQSEDTFSGKLPELRDTAKKYKNTRWNWSPDRPTKYMATSEIGRIFPDFSQNLVSDHDFSIELPRGAPANSPSPTSRNLPTNFMNSPNSSPVVTLGQTQILGTPQRGQAKESSILKDTLRNNAMKEITPRSDSRKENIPPRGESTTPESSPFISTPPSLATPVYTSHASRTVSGEHKEFADLQARVTDDDSIYSLPRKTSRFSPNISAFRKVTPKTPAPTTEQALPKQRNSAPVTNTASIPNSKQHITTSRFRAASADSTTQNPTLFSTTIGRSRAGSVESVSQPTAYTSTTAKSFFLPGAADMSIAVPDVQVPIIQGGQVLTRKQVHGAVDGMEPAEEEVVIIDSVDELRAKVSSMEREKSIADEALTRLQNQMDQMRAENEQLRSEKRSAESSLRTDIERLVKENMSLKESITKLESNKASHTKLQSRVEQLASENKSLGDLLDKLKRTNNNLTVDKKKIQYELQSEIEHLSVELHTRVEHLHIELQAKVEHLQNENQKHRRSITKLQAEKEFLGTELQLKSSSHLLTENNNLKKSITKLQSEKRTIQAEKKSVQFNLENEVEELFKQNHSLNGSIMNLNAEIRNLQADLDQASFEQADLDSTTHSSNPHDLNETLPLDDMTSQYIIADIEQASEHQITQHTQHQTTQHQTTQHQTTQNQAAQQKTTHQTAQYHAVQDETIHEDTTNHHTTKSNTPAEAVTVEENHATLSPKARDILDRLCVDHDIQNCTICVRVMQTKNHTTKQTTRVLRPVPVSERMPVTVPYEDEPTLRPTVEPGLALATVIKTLTEDIEHLKESYVRKQIEYLSQDPSKERKKRKKMHEVLQKMAAETERKSDQVYALYDVLEGQRAKGQEMEGGVSVLL